MDYETVAEAISEWIATMVRGAGAEGVALGLSGGIDSAVVAGLCSRALGRNVLGVILPCESVWQDVDDARAVAEHFGIESVTVELDDLYDELLITLPEEGNEIARANLKPRLRMTALYFFANARNYLVAGTGNRSELAVGYFTKHGDGGSDMLPIGALLKGQVRKLARHLGVPSRVVEKPPSAGLWPGQTDEDELGMSYDTLDAVVEAIQSGTDPDVSEEVLQRVRSLHGAAAHKRSFPPICRSWQREPERN